MREWDARLSLEDAGRRKSNWVFLLNLFILVKWCLNGQQGREEGKRNLKEQFEECVKGEGPSSLVSMAKSLNDKELNSSDLLGHLLAFLSEAPKCSTSGLGEIHSSAPTICWLTNWSMVICWFLNLILFKFDIKKCNSWVGSMILGLKKRKSHITYFF